MKVKPAFIIVSVYDANKSESLNQLNHYGVLDSLIEANIPFKEVVGVYKGSKEKSIMLDHRYQSIAIELSKTYNQECYLYVDAARLASLHKPNGDYIDTIGSFKEVASIDGLDNYSIIDGRYFTTIK